MENQEKALRDEYTGLRQRLEDPAIYSSKEYPALARRLSQLENLIGLFDERLSLKKELEDTRGVLGSGDPDLVILARDEMDALRAKISNNEELLSEALLPKDSNDDRDCIVEIRAA